MCDGSLAVIRILLFFNHFFDKWCHQNTAHRLNYVLCARECIIHFHPHQAEEQSLFAGPLLSF